MEKFTCSNCVAARTKCDYLQKKRAREEELKANELSQDQAQEPVKCSYCEAQDFACVIRSRKADAERIRIRSKPKRRIPLSYTQEQTKENVTTEEYPEASKTISHMQLQTAIQKATGEFLISQKRDDMMSRFNPTSLIATTIILEEFITDLLKVSKNDHLEDDGDSEYSDND